MKIGESFVLIFSINFLISEIKTTADINSRNNALDLSLYEEVLDPEKCEEELNHIFRSNRLLGLRFRDAGIRIPRGIMGGNLLDLGNYHQCLGIQEGEENLNIQGKYCSIAIPLNQEIHFPSLPEFPKTTEWSDWTELNAVNVDDEYLNKIHEYNKRTSEIIKFKGEKNVRSTSPELGGIAFTVAACIPKTCTTKEFITKLWFNISVIGLDYTENFCRLPNDRPWVPVDYVAIVTFSVIGLLVLLSTCYDLHHTIVLKKDPKEANDVYQSFSAYTNTRRLFTFPYNPKAITCLDGIRALSMLWILLGHTASTLQVSNVLEASQTVAAYKRHISILFTLFYHFLSAMPVCKFSGWLQWIISWRGLWLMASPIGVDTFFLLSGLLLVYITSGKFNSTQLMKNIHLFYLNRILRMFPLLAAIVLAQASFINRLGDGPLWIMVASLVDTCRETWWSTLLYVQNYTNPRNICLPHSWYLPVDMQVYVLSPLILVWVFKKKNNHIKAWVALITALILSLASSAIYNTIKQFASSASGTGNNDYMIEYYINTLTRASPFLVGMIFGYILYLLRGKKIKVSKVIVALTWTLISIIFSLVLYIHYAQIQNDWDNKVADVLINSFMRPTWACGLGMMVIACAHGYGGPVNWFLSNDVWKMPSRLSYAMYLIHFPLMFVGNASRLQPFNFTVGGLIFNFLAYTSLTILFSIFAMIVVDLPFANIVKIILTQDNKTSSPTLQIETHKDPSKEIATNGLSNSVHTHKQKEEER